MNESISKIRNELENNLKELKFAYKQPKLFLSNYFNDLKSNIDFECNQFAVSNQNRNEMLFKTESFEVYCLSCQKSLNNYENDQKLETIEEKINKFMGKEQEANEIKSLVKNEEFKFKRSLFLDKTIAFLKNLNNNHLIIINDEYFSQDCLESLNQVKDIMLNIDQIKVLILKQAIKNFTNNYLIELCLEINSLEEINFEHHKILSIEDSTFNNLNNLLRINLSFNELKSLNKATFKDLKNLEELNLNDNKISVIDENSFKGLVNLKCLILYNNEINCFKPDSFSDLIKLEELNISINKLSKKLGN